MLSQKLQQEVRLCSASVEFLTKLTGQRALAAACGAGMAHFQL